MVSKTPQELSSSSREYPQITFKFEIKRKSGYYFSEVEVQQRVNSNNTLNIIYDITMGEKALINEIKFIGDKKFKSSKLRSVIRSEESKFWKFLSRNKFLNKELTELDKRLLKNFYLNKGYYQVKVEDVFSQILDNKNFSLTYKLIQQFVEQFAFE